ncbi:MAG: KR domain protein [Candidatus Collierbacteria bacterium GW2011_GWA2_42_17]|uniref:KR domain protein n=1 Tax=Candidatus Collierbacteria bacterium GW2011_GWA2_42_17 TaxID=1618378 RepID=A0A0G0Z1P7_9BACT|nr:MAG: KR domain protein [Candidatus Collierbacteria bacterium GW2011_GWB2_42_12]KKS42700.1 MAG: KR domain protein [Candidatus Collierbacteria bacterium GW2011_GWA2_42_17]
MPKVILISGGSDGLGKAIAKKLAPNNQVVILSHNREKLEAVGREINCDFVEAELTDYSSLESAVKQVIAKHQTIDVLINNAGIWMEGMLDDNEPNKIKELIDVNTTGTIFLTKAVLPGMRTRKSGQIINIISQDGLCAKKDRSVYHASKWAITGFTKCLQEDLVDENIKVTGVYPGLLKTNLFEKSGVKRDLTDALDPAEVALFIETVINLSTSTHIPEFSIKNKQITPTNMDNTTTPTIDLNIDPNMIAAQDDSPQAAPAGDTPVTAPTTPVQNPSVIDITPGSTDTFPSTPVSTHIDTAPIAEPKTMDITPPPAAPLQTPPIAAPVTSPDSIAHLADVTPEPSPEPAPLATPSPSVMPSLEETPPQTPPSAPFSPNPTPVESSPVEPTSPLATQSSPLAEDPDLVKLIK